MRGLVIALALAGCAPRLRPAEAAEVAALRAGAGGDAIAAAVRVIGTAKIVGLGAPVAGGELEAGLVAGLIEAHGFTGLALDVDAAAAVELDRFVRGAAVDVDAALRGLADARAATVELRAALTRLRALNEGRTDAKARVFGLDPRDGDAAAGAVLRFLERVDPAYVPTARSLLAGGDELGLDAVLKRLEERRADYARDDVGAWLDARQAAEWTAQARGMAETWDFEAREFARARNAEWALARLGGGRLIVLASNRQVAAEVPGAAPSMGNFLRQWIGADYRAIGASYAGGQVRGEGCAVVPVVAAPGSLDAALAGSGTAVVDLRGRQAALARPQRLRDDTLRPALAFDAIWTIGQVRPATPLGGCGEP